MVVKILSYNIHKGRALFSRQKTWESIYELIHTVNADIIFLQEFIQNEDSDGFLDRLKNANWPHKISGLNSKSLCGNQYGNIILSKFLFQKTNNSNISTNAFESKGLLYAQVVPENNTPLHLFCTHLDLIAKGRYKQFSQLRSLITACTSASENMLFAGDFKDWNCEIHDKFKSEMKLREVFEQLKGILVPTSPSILPVFSLDRIYYKGIKPVKAIRVFDKKFRFLSDHLPLVAEVHV
ncbi:MAG: hypothetical protein KDD37_08740 [Bdellovibrionales bacterium]|nr:hypothetical protein [Bdellovibrionales bacterium]